MESEQALQAVLLSKLIESTSLGKCPLFCQGWGSQSCSGASYLVIRSKKGFEFWDFLLG